MHVQVGIIRCLIIEGPSEREKRIFDPFQDINGIKVEIRLVSTHSERMHPSRLLRFIGASTHWLRERIYKIKTLDTIESNNGHTKRNKEKPGRGRLPSASAGGRKTGIFPWESEEGGKV